MIAKFISYFFALTAFTLMVMGAFFLGMMLNAWLLP